MPRTSSTACFMDPIPHTTQRTVALTSMSISLKIRKKLQKQILQDLRRDECSLQLRPKDNGGRAEAFTLQEVCSQTRSNFFKNAYQAEGCDGRGG